MRLTIEVEPVFSEGGGASGRCVGAEVALTEGYRKRRVGWKIEFGVTFSPISFWRVRYREPIV